MEKYYLNFFVPILKGNRGYEFIQSNITGNNTEKMHEFNKQQEEIFKQMIDGQGFEVQELKGIFGEENITKWLKNKFLIPIAINQKEIYSRNQAFYWRSNMGNAQQILGKSTVMILGCGGIGTHVSWNMAVLGVKKIIIVDFDKVEESNLNRQILYDTQDIGRYKVDILKEKLQHINPFVQVTALNTKINSLEELETIIKQYDTDCIVKALDTPFAFSKWLDIVCHKHSRKYITGIMMNTNGAIGPTYIPQQSFGYSYFIDMPVNKEKVSGVMPSLGFIMYQLGALVSEEVFKILTNKGKLKYVNKIKIIDSINNEEITISSKKRNQLDNEYKWKNVLYILVLLLIFYIGGEVESKLIITRVLASLVAVIAPVITYSDKKQILSQGFLNTITIICFNLLNEKTREQIRIIENIPTIIKLSWLFILMSIIALSVCIIQHGLIKLKESIRYDRS